MARQKPYRSRKRAKKPAEKTLEQARVRIESIAARGDGVVHIADRNIYVAYAAPGDEAEIEYRGSRGKIRQLLEKSPYRADAPCELYGQCGGCALQHLQTDYYRDWKRALVAQALAREGFDGSVLMPLATCPTASRRRARFAVRRTHKGVIFGFNERQSDQIVDVPHCLVLASPLDDALCKLRALADAVPSSWRHFDVMVTLCDNGLDVALIGGDADAELTGTELMTLTDAARDADVIRLAIENDPVVAFAQPVISFGGVRLTPAPAGFLQASREGEAILVDLVAAQLEKARRVADLFCGCGTFSLPMSANAHVDAFDSDAAAVDALNAAARKAQLQHPITTARRNLFDRPLSAEELNQYDAVALDPPRAGAQAQSEQLAQSSVPLIIGVSCNPVSFARDARILREGGYALSQVTPVDQFVYAPHVELVGVFTKG